MAEDFGYKPPSLEDVIERLEKEPGAGANLSLVEAAVKSGELSPEKQSQLSGLFAQGYRAAFRNCFPRDAFDNLCGQNLVAKNIPAIKIDLDKGWKEISGLFNLDIPLEQITTRVAFRHFLKFVPGDAHNLETIPRKLSDYISECIRQAHGEKDIRILARMIPVFKLLGYYQKMLEKTHYGCWDEYDVMVGLGVDENNFGFRYLVKNELKETLCKDTSLYGEE